MLHVHLSSHLPLSLDEVGWYAQDILTLQRGTAQTIRDLLSEVQILIFLKLWNSYGERSIIYLPKQERRQ